MWLSCKTRAKILLSRDIADDPASLAFEAIETIIWKPREDKGGREGIPHTHPIP